MFICRIMKKPQQVQLLGIELKQHYSLLEVKGAQAHRQEKTLCARR